jgi:serine/threonine protein kinase
MNGFLLDPLYPAASYEHPFEPGELLDGRFRIVREIAQGGMGIVYEAVDEKLQRRIALKCAKTGFRKRLPPEVRNATEISHPNVCKIFEIHTASTRQGEIDFITMEFLDGETLADRLTRAPLPEKEARAIV